MPQDKKTKKPLVNWFKREKEVEYGNKKIGATTVKTKTKVVKAPDSVMSKGFTKTVEKVSRKKPISSATSDKNRKKAIGVIVGGAALGFGGLMAGANRAEKKKEEEQNAIYNQMKKGGNSKEKIDEMYKKKEANYSRRHKVASAFGALVPASFGVGVAIGSKNKERKTNKVVTKIYNDGSGTKKYKSEGKVEKVKKFKPRA